MKNFAARIMLLFLALAPFSVHGAPWISSGGDLLGDSRNPWFLMNTTSIQYCIAVDSHSVSILPNEVRVAFKKSVEFWRQEFNNNMWTQKKSSLHFIPEFVEQPCNGKEELAILMGDGSLNQTQKEFIKSAGLEAVAVAVRTDYDRVNLKGRGFIYIAGDKNNPDWIPDAWAKRITSVLAHEMGHVLGVPHQQGDFAAMVDPGKNSSQFPIALNIMSESFPQAMVLETNNFAVSLAFGILPILTGTNEHLFCDLAAETRTWLSLTAETKCVKLVLSSLDSDVFASVYAIGKNAVLIGTLNVGNSDPLLSSRVDVITQVYLNPAQKVFPPPTKWDKSIAGGIQVFASLQLSYYPSNNENPKPVLVHLSPMDITMMGIKDDTFIKVLSQKFLRPLLN